MADCAAVFTASAIVSVYKAERFIRGCLDDLIDQTLFTKGQLEIIIVNSNSPENEEPIILEYKSNYPQQITYIRTLERETIYQAWNRAIHAARGTFITNANADDRHRRDALETMAAELSRRPDIALVYADSDVTLQEGEPFETAERIGRFRWPEFDPVNLFRTCYIGPQPMWRRDLHDKHGYFDPSYRSAGDYEFWLRLIVTGENFMHIHEVLGLYLLNPNGMENSGLELSALESQKARADHWPPKWGQPPATGGQGYLWLRTSTPKVAEETPLVSVVLPTRNRPDFLCRALQSVLAQTYPAIEVLVVNDGGIDVQELITCLDQKGIIRYFNLPETVERSAARNLALRQARGRYITYLDDDDRYYPHHINTLVNQLQKSEAQVAYSVARRVAGDVIDGAFRATEEDIPFALEFDPHRLLVENYIPILCLMHERALLEKTGLFDESMSRLEDWDLWIRFAQQTRFVYIPAVTCEFTRHAGDSTGADDNAAHYLANCREIFRRYAHLAHDNPDVLHWQRKVIYQKCCYFYDVFTSALEPYVKGVDSGALEQIFHSYSGCGGITAPQIKSGLALALANNSSSDKVLELLQLALQVDHENFRARERLTNLLIRQGNYREAIKQLKMLLISNPGDQETQRALSSLACTIAE